MELANRPVAPGLQRPKTAVQTQNQAEQARNIRHEAELQRQKQRGKNDRQRSHRGIPTRDSQAHQAALEQERGSHADEEDSDSGHAVGESKAFDRNRAEHHHPADNRGSPTVVGDVPRLCQLPRAERIGPLIVHAELGDRVRGEKAKQQQRGTKKSRRTPPPHRAKYLFTLHRVKGVFIRCYVLEIRSRISAFARPLTLDIRHHKPSKTASNDMSATRDPRQLPLTT